MARCLMKRINVGIIMIFQQESFNAGKKWWIWLITAVGALAVILISCYLVQRKFKLIGKLKLIGELHKLSLNSDDNCF